MKDWIERLTDEDLSFIRRFVLASGSLKELGAAYGVSYPTVRLRLNRLIERVRIFENKQITSEFERVSRAEFAAGRIDMATLKLLLSAHKKEMEKANVRKTRGR